mmetsp:Transcript_24141/g.52748  ORF Transcript_24141/g.52748 Transcript_24141/m.52748 type:complete len:92 (+) Transcript_24141:33-308(+)
MLHHSSLNININVYLFTLICITAQHAPHASAMRTHVHATCIGHNHRQKKQITAYRAMLRRGCTAQFTPHHITSQSTDRPTPPHRSTLVVQV